jgi:predicted nuclease of predicted toxin-antitoxin system
VNIVIDESVSYSLANILRDAGHTVVAIAESPTSGLSDEEIFKLTMANSAILITRDYHFTNAVRFDPKSTKGIIYIRYGNLTTTEEIGLVQGFLSKHPPEYYSGKLVTLYRDSVKIRG